MTKKVNEVFTKDFVIDTCVLAHACQDTYPLHESALALVEWLRRQSAAKWVLDDNGKKAPAIETSTLYAEYHATLPPQSLPLILLARYMQFGLVNFSPRPNQQLRNLIRDLVPRNRKDQVILGAAAGCQDKVLLSNDEDDFPPDVRVSAASKIGVKIICSDQIQL